MKREDRVLAGSGESMAKKAAVFLLLLLVCLFWSRAAGSQDEAGGEADESAAEAAERMAIVLDVEGPIGPATRDFLTRSLETAEVRGAALVVIRMDTPGGLDASTRDIV